MTAEASAPHAEQDETRHDPAGQPEAPSLDPVDPAAYLRSFRGETLRRATTALAEGGAYVTTTKQHSTSSGPPPSRT